MKEILRYMPSKISEKILEGIEDKLEKVEEIRLRVERPIILRLHDGEKVIKYSVSTEEMIACLQAICENSIYTYQNQIAEGFVTIKGGHRVGIAGSCVVENGKIININHIYSLNFRIARQVVGSGNKILKYILNLEKNTIYNTLIVSSPGAGKTTVLRDIVRQVSSGIKEIKFVAVNVGVVDERGEIAALYKGAPQNDIGIKTDILDNLPKSIGMKMLIRSMTPEIIVADEIGSFEDIEAIKYAICSGCRGLFTAHGSSFSDISLNPIIKSLIGTNIIERVIFLDEKNRGKVKDVYGLNKKTRRIRKNGR